MSKPPPKFLEICSLLKSSLKRDGLFLKERPKLIIQGIGGKYEKVGMADNAGRFFMRWGVVLPLNKKGFILDQSTMNLLMSAVAAHQEPELPYDINDVNAVNERARMLLRSQVIPKKKASSSKKDSEDSPAVVDFTRLVSLIEKTNALIQNDILNELVKIDDEDTDLLVDIFDILHRLLYEIRRGSDKNLEKYAKDFAIKLIAVSNLGDRSEISITKAKEIVQANTDLIRKTKELEEELKEAGDVAKAERLAAERARGERQEIVREKGDLNRENIELQSQVLELKGKLKTLEQKFAQKPKVDPAKLVSMNESISGLKTDLEDLINSLGADGSKLGGVDTKKLRADVVKLKQMLEEGNKAQADAQEKIDALEAEIKYIEAALASTEDPDRTSELETKRFSLMDAQRSYVQYKDRLEGRCLKIEQQLKPLETLLATLQEAIDNPPKLPRLSPLPNPPLTEKELTALWANGGLTHDEKAPTEAKDVQSIKDALEWEAKVFATLFLHNKLRHGEVKRSLNKVFLAAKSSGILKHLNIDLQECLGHIRSGELSDHPALSDNLKLAGKPRGVPCYIWFGMNKPPDVNIPETLLESFLHKITKSLK